MNPLQKRVLDISYQLHLSHLSSCLNAVTIIDKIYASKKDNEPFILSQGHAALALYVVLEKYYGFDAIALFKKHGTHPNRCMEDKIWCSTGSLGQGVTVAVGMAIADKTRDVYVLMSDGELSEGSCWEALSIAGELKLENLKVSVVANGYSAYRQIDPELLDLRLQYFYPSLVINTNVFEFPDWLQGLNGHYVTMDEQKYKEVSNA